MIVYGSGNADGNRHTHANLPVVLAGGGGGTLTPGPLRQARLQADDEPVPRAWPTASALSDLERFGDSTGRLGDV